MDQALILVIVAVTFSFIGAIIGYYVRQSIAKKRAGSIEEELERKLNQTKEKSEEIIKRANERVRKVEKATLSNLEKRQQTLIQAESRLLKKEETVENKLKGAEEKEREVQERVNKVKQIKENVEKLREEVIKKLEDITGLKKEDAKNEFFQALEREYEAETLERIRKLQIRGEEQYDKKAKEILATAIQKFALSQAQEITTTTVDLPSEEIKGRIIGKEGRNIRAFEKKTGIELIVDETPDTVILSGFNPIRREIARIALERLIRDGRIQPARIEAEIEKAEAEVAKKVKEAGEAAVYETGVLDLPEKIVQILGRLHYRTSYGQNVLLHSMEVSFLAAALASEIGADVGICKKAGLLHDIGKALDYQIEGSHTDIGARILEKFKINPRIISAMKSHHEEYPYESVEAVIVQIADQISGARPGVRKDTLEKYLKRLEDLEDIALSFEGVERAFAIQGGREIRVFVAPQRIDDLTAQKLARKIANRIQEELKYPGEIKVNVIRETRIIEYAK